MRARILLVFVLLAAVSLSAQTFRGTILGTVTDAQGAVVSGAKVTVKNVATGLERSTETSADGSYAHRGDRGRFRRTACGCCDEAGPSFERCGSVGRTFAPSGNHLS